MTRRGRYYATPADAVVSCSVSKLNQVAVMGWRIDQISVARCPRLATRLPARVSSSAKTGSLCCPPATECLVELDDGDEMEAVSGGEREFGIEQVTFGKQDVDITGNTALIAQIGHVQGGS